MNRISRPMFPEVRVEAREQDDGSIILRNLIAPPPSPISILDRLRHWAGTQASRPFLSEPDRADGRKIVSYGEALGLIEDMGPRLLALGLDSERPLLILGGNGIHHALLMLAATDVGIPVAIVSPAYSSPSAAPFGKLGRVLDQITPGIIAADAPGAVEEALRQLSLPDGSVRSLVDLQWLQDHDPAPLEAVRFARQSVGLDTVAKLLFTSGSTGSPKAVINTQRMMVSNMAAISAVWPFLLERPPVLVDWLPWNHTFGGNCCFNIVLYFGGTLHIDHGKPLPHLIGLTADALRTIQPTVYFNVPAGFEALLPLLEADHNFARNFFGGLDFLFNGGAAMPASIRRRIEELSLELIGFVPSILVGWGSTETAPFSSIVYFDTEHAANLGVPLPGTEIKMVPSAGRMELRVRGPNVTPGYWRNPEMTEAAFDAEGFYRIGDAGRFAEPGNPAAGLVFDGRTAENFKLNSGTWVNVGALRLAVIADLRPLVSDAVVTGEGYDELGLLLFCNQAACDAALTRPRLPGEAEAAHDRLAGLIRQMLAVYNSKQSGSSTRIARFQILAEPPQHDRDEITDKGYLNQRAILSRRAAIVEALYVDGHLVADG